MKRDQSGFTLFELGVVVVTIGILAAIIAPRFASAKSVTKITTAAQDIQRIVDAIMLYHANSGYWPPDTATGKIPPEIRRQFKGDDPFVKPTPIGGIFDYDNLKASDTIGITIRETMTTRAPTIADAQALDAYLDDGILNKGDFRSTYKGGYTYTFSVR